MQQTKPMNTSNCPYHRHRFPVEIISHCVWLYFRFSLSFRDVEEMLAMRGVCVSYETIREWCLKFGQTYANSLRRKSPRPGDRWHLDEVFLKINGRLHYLWRAVDQDGDVLDILVQSRRDKKAAKKFFRKLIKALRYVPRGHCQLNSTRNRISDASKMDPAVVIWSISDRLEANRPFTLPFRERTLRFLSAFGAITSHFRVGRHLYEASAYRAVMTLRFAVWEEAICSS